MIRDGCAPLSARRSVPATRLARLCSGTFCPDVGAALFDLGQSPFVISLRYSHSLPRLKAGPGPPATGVAVEFRRRASVGAEVAAFLRFDAGRFSHNFRSALDRKALFAAHLPTRALSTASNVHKERKIQVPKHAQALGQLLVRPKQEILCIRSRIL